VAFSGFAEPHRAVIITGADWTGHVWKATAPAVRDGKGLVAIHYASGAFEDWTEFRNLVGRTQRKKHDKRGPFTVNITNPNHPVSRGMKDFETDDELFIELQGERPIEVLATARSKITGLCRSVAHECAQRNQQSQAHMLFVGGCFRLRQ
jgi:type 1 glutamine amidotransferase